MHYRETKWEERTHLMRVKILGVEINKYAFDTRRRESKDTRHTEKILVYVTKALVERALHLVY